MADIDNYVYDLFRGGDESIYGFSSDDSDEYGFGTDELYGYDDALDNMAYEGEDVSDITDDKFYQYYVIEGYQPEDVQTFIYTINCHARTRQDSRDLAKLFYDENNRQFGDPSDGQAFNIITIQEPFSTEEHDWICPVELRIKTNL
jgi:hypothetical protein